MPKKIYGVLFMSLVFQYLSIPSFSYIFFFFSFCLWIRSHEWCTSFAFLFVFILQFLRIKHGESCCVFYRFAIHFNWLKKYNSFTLTLRIFKLLQFRFNAERADTFSIITIAYEWQRHSKLKTIQQTREVLTTMWNKKNLSALEGRGRATNNNKTK